MFDYTSFTIDLGYKIALILQNSDLKPNSVKSATLFVESFFIKKLLIENLSSLKESFELNSQNNSKLAIIQYIFPQDVPLLRTSKTLFEIIIPVIKANASRYSFKARDITSERVIITFKLNAI